jgi:hypothetical protein
MFMLSKIHGFVHQMLCIIYCKTRRMILDLSYKNVALYIWGVQELSVKFKKTLIDDVRFEAASVFDVNNDGIPDIICGENWYEGPDFKKKHKICDIMYDGSYHDDFCDYGMDVNNDGLTDIITGAWTGETLRWRENPGNDGEWKEHVIDRCGNIETIRFCDIDSCGIPEILPNTPNGPQAVYKLVTDKNGKGTGIFEKFVISEGQSGHGLGYGDINGDGRIDIILHNGWLEQPKDPYAGTWEFHQEFELDRASVPVLVYDVNKDGIPDLISGQAHDYGLAWCEQKIGEDGERTWIKHDIDTTASQYHDMVLADIDNDGEPELITGKRFWAHCGRDPGETDPLGIYYFKINGGVFEKHVIDYGPAGTASGCGIYFWAEDINGDGRLDIIAPGKDGLYLFVNLGE